MPYLASIASPSGPPSLTVPDGTLGPAGQVGPRTLVAKLKLFAIYAPYLVLPLALTIYMAAHEFPFGAPGKLKRA